MTRDAIQRITAEWGDAVAAIQSSPGAPDYHDVGRAIAMGDLMVAALRSRPAPPDDLERKHRVPDDVMMLARAGKLIDAIKLLRHDFELPLKEAKLLVEDAMRIEAIRATAAALAAPTPVAAPAPAPQMLNENPVVAAKTRAVMQQIALNNMTTVEQCPGLLAFGPIYRALAAPAVSDDRIAALLDSQYRAGAKAGWNAAHGDKPDEAIARLIGYEAGSLAPVAAPAPTGRSAQEIARDVRRFDSSSAAPAPETPAPDAMPVKCSACGASVELCLEYALTALGSTTKCCEQCDHGRRQEAQP